MNDPKELRAAALDHREWCHESHHDVPPWVDYILATVRDDDGEEQEDVATGWYDGLQVLVIKSLNYVQVSIAAAGGQSVTIPFKTFTRGQFRDLCRGLGVDTEGK